MNKIDNEILALFFLESGIIFSSSSTYQESKVNITFSVLDN